MPAPAPFGFHGSWADADVLDKAIAAQRHEFRARERCPRSWQRLGAHVERDPGPR